MNLREHKLNISILSRKVSIKLAITISFLWAECLPKNIKPTQCMISLTLTSSSLSILSTLKCKWTCNSCPLILHWVKWIRIWILTGISKCSVNPCFQMGVSQRMDSIKATLWWWITSDKMLPTNQISTNLIQALATHLRKKLSSLRI